ncbi:MAG: hypothetical protein M1546_05975 [Chloroflexi bacterium]|nr:hypothetical protein [Chloroflexota bacterium]
MDKPRVLIVDTALDEPALLRSAPSIVVVGETQDAQQAIASAIQLQPDVVVLSVDTLCADDVQLIARVSHLDPHIKLMIVSANDIPERLALEAYRAGARAHLVKARNTLSEIVEAIHALVRGESVLSPQMAGRILDEITGSPQKQGEA